MTGPPSWILINIAARTMTGESRTSKKKEPNTSRVRLTVRCQGRMGERALLSCNRNRSAVDVDKIRLPYKIGSPPPHHAQKRRASGTPGSSGHRVIGNTISDATLDHKRKESRVRLCSRKNRRRA